MSATNVDRLHVDWVESGSDLQAFVAGECVAAADWDGAADAVAAVLRQLARDRPAGYVVADFTHGGEFLGTVRVDAEGQILAAEEDEPDEPGYLDDAPYREFERGPGVAPTGPAGLDAADGPAVGAGHSAATDWSTDRAGSADEPGPARRKSTRLNSSHL